MSNYRNQQAVKILVVDDEPSSRFLISTLLSLYDFSVIQAADGKEALNAVQSQAIDLILLDIMMPEMDGFTVCKHLKSDRSTRSIPVIFISALVDEESRMKANLVGGEGYINKPFIADELIQMLSAQPTMLRVQQPASVLQ
ncbi:MAG: response regulator [Chloroflexota bacterium]